MNRKEADKVLIAAAKDVRDALDYNPGHSDLDNEQPINITIPLGTWRRLSFALAILESEESQEPFIPSLADIHDCDCNTSPHLRTCASRR